MCHWFNHEDTTPLIQVYIDDGIKLFQNNFETCNKDLIIYYLIQDILFVCDKSF